MAVDPIPKRKSPYYVVRAEKPGKIKGGFRVEDPELEATEELRRTIRVHYDSDIEAAADAIRYGTFPRHIIEPLWDMIERGQVIRTNANIYDALQKTAEKRNEYRT